MCLIRNCGCSNSELLRFCCLLCTARQEFIDLAYKYDTLFYYSTCLYLMYTHVNKRLLLLYIILL